mmetsp:Transcript_70192/g.196470  ORF Transcript_70192/g.196470 Transcript_70192/m.196470 type:complete len:328 (-) Transcript_70192:193-1176(-)
MGTPMQPRTTRTSPGCYEAPSLYGLVLKSTDQDDNRRSKFKSPCTPLPPLAPPLPPSPRAIRMSSLTEGCPLSLTSSTRWSVTFPSLSLSTYTLTMSTTRGRVGVGRGTASGSSGAETSSGRWSDTRTSPLAQYSTEYFTISPPSIEAGTDGTSRLTLRAPCSNMRLDACVSLPNRIVYGPRPSAIGSSNCPTNRTRSLRHDAAIVVVSAFGRSRCNCRKKVARPSSPSVVNSGGGVSPDNDPGPIPEAPVADPDGRCAFWLCNQLATSVIVSANPPPKPSSGVTKKSTFAINSAKPSLITGDPLSESSLIWVLVTADSPAKLVRIV